MTEQIKQTDACDMNIAMVVQAAITLILTITVVVLTVMNMTLPELITSVWLVSIGVWIPLPNRR